MNPGEAFEEKCYEYLKKTYSSPNTTFERRGGMNSTESDIAVIKNGAIGFYMEAKSPVAQSGQFVLLPDDENKRFVFSPKNRSIPTAMTQLIIEHMNDSFDYYKNAGTAGIRIEIDTRILANWIIDYYESKGVKYFISYNDGFVIFPVRKFAGYFEIFANFRTKKSGSQDPAKRDFPAIKTKIQKTYPLAEFIKKGSKIFTKISEPLITDHFELGGRSYLLASQDIPNLYRIRQLSNTHNSNVIFSIHIKKKQNPDDLAEFKTDLF